jgi:hypothetical protein
MTRPSTTAPHHPTDAFTARTLPAVLVTGGLAAAGLSLAATRPWQVALGWVVALGCVAVGTHRAAKAVQS